MAEPCFQAPPGTRLTQKEDGTHLYIHLQVYPFAHLTVSGLSGKLTYARFLHDHSEILYDEKKETGEVVFRLPVVKPRVITPVIDVLLAWFK